MMPTAVRIPNRSGTTSSVSIEPQVSWGARPSRPGREIAWAIERRAANGTNERILVAGMGREGKASKQTQHWYAFVFAPFGGSVVVRRRIPTDSLSLVGLYRQVWIRHDLADDPALLPTGVRCAIYKIPCVLNVTVPYLPGRADGAPPRPGKRDSWCAWLRIRR